MDPGNKAYPNPHPSHTHTLHDSWWTFPRCVSKCMCSSYMKMAQLLRSWRKTVMSLPPVIGCYPVVRVNLTSTIHIRLHASCSTHAVKILMGCNSLCS